MYYKSSTPPEEQNCEQGLRWRVTICENWFEGAAEEVSKLTYARPHTFFVNRCQIGRYIFHLGWTGIVDQGRTATNNFIKYVSSLLSSVAIERLFSINSKVMKLKRLNLH